MSTVLAIAAAVLAVSLLIVLHEAGHFLAARRCGMRVERFSVGFGPVVAAFRRGETEFVVSALPLGGYVRIAGMSPGDDVDPADRRAYANQAAWRRFLVIVAGPAANYVTAVLVAAALLATIGLRAPDPAPRVGALVPDMPAAAAGLLPGDRILSVAGAPVDSFRALVVELQRHPGERIMLEVERGAERLALPITPRDDGGVGRVGFSPGAARRPPRPGGRAGGGARPDERRRRGAARRVRQHVLGQAARGALRAGRHRPGARAWRAPGRRALPRPRLDDLHRPRDPEPPAHPCARRRAARVPRVGDDHPPAREREDRELRPPRRLHRARRASSSP